MQPVASGNDAPGVQRVNSLSPSASTICSDQSPPHKEGQVGCGGDHITLPAQSTVGWIVVQSSFPGVVVCHRPRLPRRLVALKPGACPSRAGRRRSLGANLVERPTGDLLNEDSGDHVASVRVLEALAGSEVRRSVGDRMVHQLDRTPLAARLLRAAARRTCLRGSSWAPRLCA